MLASFFKLEVFLCFEIVVVVVVVVVLKISLLGVANSWFFE